MQEDYIKDEQKNLKKEYLHAQEEVKRIQSVPLVIGQFLEAVDQNNGIVGSTTGTSIASTRLTEICVSKLIISTIDIPVWVRGCRIGPLRFLAVWHKRRLNQAFSFVLV